VETLDHALVSCPLAGPNTRFSAVKKEVHSSLKSKPTTTDLSKLLHPDPILVALGYLHPKAHSRLKKLGVEEVEKCLGCIHIALLEASHTIWLARCENFNNNHHPSSLSARKEAVGIKDFSLLTMFRTRGLSTGNPSVSEEDD